MNERIKELAEQAGIEFGGEGGDKAWQSLVIFEKEDLAKFAELIVRECIEQLNIPGVTHPISAGLNLGKVAIKEHFEVRE